MRPPFRLRVCASALILFASHAWALTPSTPAAPSEWKELDGQYYRLDANGDFSCYSEDAWNCKPGAPSRYPELVRPLSCGRDAQAKWGVTGYDTRGHWCNTAHAKLFARWQDYDILGLPVLLATNANGDPMCASADGRECLWGDARATVKQADMVPLVCGRAHASVHPGFTGYEKELPHHWCQSPEILRQQTDPPLAIDFAPSKLDWDQWHADDPTSPSTATYEFPAVPGLAANDLVWVARLKSNDPMLFGLQREDGRHVLIEPLARGLMTVRIQPADDLQYWASHSWEPVLFQRLQLWDDRSGYLAHELDASAQASQENKLTLTFTSRTATAWDQPDNRPFIREAVIARKRPAPRISH
jgi:hypothetical protein